MKKRHLNKGESGIIMKYDKHMDEECIPLCNALNSIPGIITVDSCCGHEKHDFRIWFYLEDGGKVNYLKVVSTAFDPRYGGIDGWVCTLENSDIVDHLPFFKISSGKTVGEQAYKESRVIATNIRELLNHQQFMEELVDGN